MKLLVVDDDVLVTRVLERVLRDHDTVVERDVDAAIASATRADAAGQPFDLVLCDLCLGQRSGLEVRTATQKLSEPPAFVMMSGHDAVADCGFATLIKPFPPDELRALLSGYSRR